MKQLTILSCFLLCMLGQVLAQSKRVVGTVSDASGKGIEGVSVSVKGKPGGVITNATGNYSIAASVGDKLYFSFVGFVPQEQTAQGSGLDVILTAANTNLGEVVVVGYGSQRKANVISAITTVKGSELIKRPLASTSMALQGFAPGVVIQQGSGQPGADGGSINIRGIGSITNSSSPLIIVDGVEGVSINDVDPNVIESISVLKDAASTAVYGVRGTNGVILIKTKRGAAGKTSVSFNSFVSKQTPTNFPELISSVDHMILFNEFRTNAGGAPQFSQADIDRYSYTPVDNLNVFDTDWKGLIFQNSGMMQNHNLIVNGGSDKVSFLASGTYLNQQGIVTNNSFKKYDLRLNGDINLSRKVKFTTDLFYTKATNTQPAGMSPNEIVQRGISMARLWPAKFADGQYGDAGQTNRINPVAAAEASGLNLAETPTLSVRFALNAEVFRNFVVEAAYNSRSSWTEAYVARTAYASYNPNPAGNNYLFAQMVGDSLLSYTNNRLNSNQYYASGTYSFQVKKNHQFRVQGGFQGLDNLVTSVGASRAGLSNPDRPYLNLATGSFGAPSGSANDFALAGFFGRLNYNFKQTYLLEATGRYDGSSRFSQLSGKQWGFFPSVSAGWVISKETFMEKLDFINYAKLRVSYGKLGNQELGSNYPFVAQLNAGTAYYFNNTLTPGSSLNNIPNETVSWENSAQSNIGVDLAFLKSKLNVTFDIYQKKITDMLIDFPVANALGYAGSSVIPANAGSMVNKGWEFSANYRDKVGDFNYSITANLSDVRNEVLDTKGLDIVQGNQVSRAGFPVRAYQLYRTNRLYQPGENYNLPYNGTRTTGAGDIKYVDMDGNDTLNAKDRMLMGNNFPRYDFSLNLNADYKGFDLNIFLFGVAKRDNYISGVGVEPFNAGNWFATGLTSALERWTPQKTNSAYPRLFSGGNGNYIASDFWLRNGAFMRVKHITLGYTLDKKWADKIGVQQLRFYVNAVNPLTFSNYEPGFDPEISNTNGAFYPIMKTTTIGVNLRF